MSRIQTIDDVRSLGTILGIWAHPDDESYSMAGLMAAAVRHGQTVVCITATRGEAGVQDEARWPADRLADIRTQELQAAFAVLGVTHHHWLDYPDGGCAQVHEAEAVHRIATIMRTYNPDSILTFGSEGMTGHDDHKTVSRWAHMAREKLGGETALYHAIQTQEQYEQMVEADREFNVFFNIDKPPICKNGDCAIRFVLPDDIYAQKLKALHAMPSQTEAMLKKYAHALRGSIGTEAFVVV